MPSPPRTDRPPEPSGERASEGNTTDAPVRPVVRDSDSAPPVALSLGANLGEIESVLRRAIEHLATYLDGAQVAALFQSPPVGGPPQPVYTNTALVGRARLAPEELLAVAKALEKRAGRRPGPRYGPRPLDVDLLVWGSVVRRHPELELPHPRLATRRFYLEPLASLAPELPVPPAGMTVAELLARLPESAPLGRRDWNRPPALG